MLEYLSHLRLHMSHISLKTPYFSCEMFWLRTPRKIPFFFIHMRRCLIHVNAACLIGMRHVLSGTSQMRHMEAGYVWCSVCEADSARDRETQVSHGTSHMRHGLPRYHLHRLSDCDTSGIHNVVYITQTNASLKKKKTPGVFGKKMRIF